MQPISFYSDVISNIKSSTSCVDLCRFSLHLPVSYSGQTIHAPSFIRNGDSHPSFAVYDDHAYDYSTGYSYDIFNLLMLAKGLTFAQAFEEISGKPLRSYLPEHSTEHDHFAENQHRLEQNVKAWHQNLLSSQKCLDYLKERCISRDTIIKMYLGYDPKTDRLIIPFFKNGKIVYYSGRDMSGRNDPKYLGAKTDYGVRKIPFGLQSVKPAYKKKSPRKSFEDVDGSDELTYLKSSTLVLTEGLIDAVSLIQDSWSVLASGGGFFGKNNLRFVLDIARMFDRVCLAYDNDEAGKKFQIKMARLLVGEQIPFICVQIPQMFDGHIVKDINDYYCAGGKFEDLARSAEPGIAYCGGQLNDIKEVYDFVKSVAGYASAWDLDALFTRLSERTIGSLAGDIDPENPDTMDTRPLFTKAQLRAAFKAAGSRLTDKELMRRVLKKHQLTYSTDGKFYEYNHRYWEQVTKETVKRYISQVIGERATEGRCNAVMSLMKIELEDPAPFNPQNVVTFQNGVLLLDETDLDKRFVPHNPDFRCTFMEDFCLKMSSRPKADATWLKFSGQVKITHEDDYYERLYKSELWKSMCVAFPAKSGALNINPEWAAQGIPAPNVDLIREFEKMCGYIYFPDNRLEQGFILMGKGGNGKSTLMQIIEEVVGTDFCTHLSPDRMASCFDKIVLKNSILNICHEAKPDVEGAEETMKAVISGNPIMASYKGQDTISFKTRAKLLISANNPMEIKDVSYGLARRLTIFPFDTKISEERKDPDLLDKLRKEKALIFEWMYDGYLMLKHGEKFTPTPEQLARKEQLQEFIDHTLTFVREYLVEGDYVDALDRMQGMTTYIPMRRLPTDRVMYQWYLKWCKETNTEPLPRYVALGRINDAIREKCPEMKIIKCREVSTGRERDTYVMSDFADKLENINVYDIDSQDAIMEVFSPKDKITSEAVRIDEKKSSEFLPPVSAAAEDKVTSEGTRTDEKEANFGVPSVLNSAEEKNYSVRGRIIEEGKQCMLRRSKAAPDAPASDKPDPDDDEA